MRLLRLFHRRNLAACLFGLVLAASWKFGIAILSAGPNVPRLEIARREVDLGQVAAGHAIPVEFPVRNAGSARLIVRASTDAAVKLESNLISLGWIVVGRHVQGIEVLDAILRLVTQFDDSGFLLGVRATGF